MNSERRDEAPHSPQLTRRDLLQGKLWKLLGTRSSAGESIQSNRPPRSLVMRYPTSRQEVLGDDQRPDEAPPVSSPERSIHGISLSPVGPAETHAYQPPSRAAAIPVFRPPGAIEESQFLAGCTRCNACAAACPHQAIVQAPNRLRGLQGTPILDPDSQPCLMCEDTPCISACEPGVLSNAAPKIMGTARVTEHLCLAHHGTICTVCSERCPVEGAIEVADGKPTIAGDVCTGCGVCRYVCPAPENAILLMPMFARSSAEPEENSSTWTPTS